VEGAAVVAAGALGTSRATTDRTGSFVVSGLAAGWYQLTAARAGYLDGAYGRRRFDGPSAPIQLLSNSQFSGVTITLWRLGSLSGLTADETGEPLIGVDVIVLRRSAGLGPPQWAFEAKRTTDDRGEYRFAGLKPGQYVAVLPVSRTTAPKALVNRTVLKSRFVENGAADVLQQYGLPLSTDPASGRVLVYPTTVCPYGGTSLEADALAVNEQDVVVPSCTVRQEPGVTVSGLLELPDGSPAPASIPVRLVPSWLTSVPSDASNELAELTVTDADGRFVFGGVPTGDYIAQVVSIPPPVFPDGRPLSPAQRAAFLQDAAVNELSAHVVSQLVKRAWPPTQEQTLGVSATLDVASEDLRTTLRLHSMPRISGRIVLDDGRQPPADVLKSIAIVQDPDDGRYVGALPYYVAEDGSFDTYGAPPGKYILAVANVPRPWSVRSVAVDGRNVTDTPVRLSDGEMAGVVVTLTDTAKKAVVRGKVVGGDGQAPIEVLLIPADQTTWMDGIPRARSVRESEVSPDGAYEIAGVAAGDYVLVAVSGNGPAWSTRFFGQAAQRGSLVHVGEGSDVSLNLQPSQLQQ